MPKSKIDWSPANWPRLLFRFFSSYGLAAVVLVFLTIITLFGTYYQVDNGLIAAKRKYFTSWFLIHEFFGKFPVPLPGGLLLMLILFINMTIGAVIKVRKRWRGIGLLISHFGMLMLLAGGFVTFAFATDGNMTLYQGMKSSQVQSYRKWQIEVRPVIGENKAEKAWVIPSEALEKLDPNEGKTYDLPDLPFDVRVSQYYKNANAVPTSAPVSANAPGKEIDGFKLLQQELFTEAERNIPGCVAEFVGEDGEKAETILWGYSSKFLPDEKPMPFIFEMGGNKYAALITKKTWSVPFEVQLDKFIFEKHPGTQMARNFESRVTRMESDQPEKKVEIKMNEPMRYAGFTFFQESYGPPNAPIEEMFSQFAVAENPADQWPLWALVITGIGLAIHFVISLMEYSKKSRSNRAKS